MTMAWSTWSSGHTITNTVWWGFFLIALYISASKNEGEILFWRKKEVAEMTEKES